MSQRTESQSFIRQGSWMVIATTAGGVFMFSVHIFGMWMTADEYGLFNTLLQFLNLMMIPALGLQTVFAQQAAGTFTQEEHQRLAGTVKSIFKGTFLLWVVILCLTGIFHAPLLQRYHIDNPAALWITVVVALPQLWLPVLLGLMQGTQNFRWLGLSQILNGLGRFVAVGLIVTLLGGQAAGAMTGALIGFTTACLFGWRETHRLWAGPAEPIQWSQWISRLVPLMLGLGSALFMMSFDMIAVRAKFKFAPELTGFYGFSGLLGRGLVIFTTPLAQVMFPKVITGMRTGSPTDVLRHAVVTTAGLALLIALGCSAFFVVFPGFLEALLARQPAVLPAALQEKLLRNREGILLSARLIPAFMWAMAPLAVANVLINNLLALRRNHAVPWLVAVAAGYGIVLQFLPASFSAVLITLGAFNLLLLATAARFTYRQLPTAI